MNLRPYQEEFIDKSLAAFADGHRRVLSVCATGGGKTIIASELMRREVGNCLFLADAEELIKQNADKYQRHTGETCGVERGASRALLGVDRVIVATTQTLFRRVENYPDDYFNLIIVDEAHRNSLGAMSKKVLEHFGEYANILGMTATPFRSDRKKLGDFYETIPVDIGLDRLIREGYLSRIMIKGVPLNIDLSAVRAGGGDYNATDLDDAIEPHLIKAAELLRATIKEHKRKASVVFLPLVKTSKRFVEILCGMGVRAVHVDGVERGDLHHFSTGRAEVVCNAALLTTGWDCPQVDCVYILRPTKSLALYSQMVGRGTRIHKDKDHLLLLDPLYLHEDHKLITPAALVATDPLEAAQIMKKVREGEASGGFADLLGAEERADADREASLKLALEENEKKDPRLVDAMEFAQGAGAADAASFGAPSSIEGRPPTTAQLAELERNGFNTDSIKSLEQASRLLDLLFTRREKGFATPKQLRQLRRHKYPNAEHATFEEAGAFLDKLFSGKRSGERSENTNPITALQMVKLRAAGIDPKTVKSREEAVELLAGNKAEERACA